MNTVALQTLSVVGIFLSLYATYVETRINVAKIKVAKSAATPESYAPLCDISEHISCAKAFTSEYGNFLGISNSTLGVLFYIIIILATLLYPIGVLPLAIMSVVGSVYLAYISYIKLHNVCIICTSIYVVNLLLLYFALF